MEDSAKVVAPAIAKETIHEIVQTGAVMTSLLKLTSSDGYIKPMTTARDTKSKKDKKWEHSTFNEYGEDGSTTTSVLVNSEAAEANSFETVIVANLNRLGIVPHLALDMNGSHPNFLGRLHDGKITSLELPHRCVDGHFRMGYVEENGKKVEYMKSELGDKLTSSSSNDLSFLISHDIASLIFGSWFSNKSLLGIKQRRILQSRLVGVGWLESAGVKSRIDPIITAGKLSDVIPECHKDHEDVKIANLNLGNVMPSAKDVPGGGMVKYVRENPNISIRTIRRMEFLVDGKRDEKLTRACRSLVLALSLASVALRREDGTTYALRSGCDLFPMPGQSNCLWSVNGEDGAVKKFLVEPGTIVKIYKELVDDVQRLGLKLVAETVVTPSPSIIKYVNSLREKFEAAKDFRAQYLKPKSKKKGNIDEQDQEDVEVEVEVEDEDNEEETVAQ